jgi:trimethylamine--corrinoid protein Co-methyltransferase
MWTGSAQVLSEKDAIKIHESSLKILEHTGVNILNDEILIMMESAGAVVEKDEKIAKIPSKLIEEALHKAPATITLYGREDRDPFTIGEGTTRSASGFDATFIQDHGSVERRPITKDEVGIFARLADRLPDIDIVGVQGIPQDVPQDKTEAFAAQMLLQNTSKHILVAPDTGKSARAMLKMVSQVTGTVDIGSRPVLSVHISPSAPLRWTPAACDVILEVVRAGVPFYILPAPIAGATSPVTLAGHLVQHNCQILTGLLIAQLMREGHPVVYCNAHTLFNMREGNPVIATPETMLLRFAGAQMARHYNIPSHSIGFDTDAHIIDQQGAWEKALSAMACITAGIDVMVNLGMYSTGLTVSYESLIIDHEVFSMLRRFQRGIEMSNEHLALDVMERIGTWGSYLSEEHTLRHFKSENWYPDISCRKLFERWVEDGAEDMLEVAHKKATQLLSEPAETYVDEDLMKNLDRVIESEE